MLFFQSIIVYCFMICVMIHYGRITYKAQYPLGYGNIDRMAEKENSLCFLFSKSYYVIPISIFCLFAALRFRVGVDCETYKVIFYELVQYGQIFRRSEEIEWGYVFLSKMTGALTGSHFLLFYIMALLQIGLYYNAFKKESYIFIFLSIGLFLTGEYWSWMNGMRQNIAACAFVAMIPWIINKKWKLGICGIAAAMLIHKSALIILPFGIIAYFSKDKILNKYIQIAILTLCFILMNKLNVLSFFDIAMHAGYTKEAISAYEELEGTNRTFGFRMILLYTTYLIAIFHSDKMFVYFKSQKFNICYNLFFIGICILVLFYNDFTIIRIAYYFFIFIPVTISYLLFYLYLHKKKILFSSIIIMLAARTLYDFYSALKQPMMEAVLYKFDF